MDTHLLALQLMAAQGCLGAFDTLYHHELTEALPQRSSALRELRIHALRALIYSLLFIGLSAWQWHGIWAAVLLGMLGVEILLTLWDFVIEDQTRLLPASERVTHTILAINGGAFIMLLLLNMPAWLAQTSALHWQPHGGLSIFLALCGVGVGLSGMRDAFAAFQIARQQQNGSNFPALHFSDNAEQVLVTGATGFIGQRLVQALVADGHQVTVLARRPRQAAWLFGGQVRCIGSMHDLPPSCPIDVIVNLAGAPILGWRWTIARQQVLRQSRIALTQSVVAWIGRSKRKPRLLLSASAIGYYGIQSRGDQAILNEASPSQPIFMSQLCQDWEVSAQAAGAHGVRVICMRLGVVFGQQGALPMMLLPIKLGLGGRLGSGLQVMSWIHIQDVLRGMAHLWRLPAGTAAGDAGSAGSCGQMQPGQDAVEVYNFTAPESVTQQQFSEIAAQVMRRPCIVPTPAWPMRLALGEQADLLLEGQRVAPVRMHASGFVFAYPEVKSALQNLC